jgi:8-oxo-dGTP pyrophosphatase MutT (NUDIX family)
MLPFRQVARVIVIDSTGFVLLCRYTETRAGQRHSFWVPPGGALEPGEDHPTAALRELREETGLEAHLGRPLWERRFTLQMRHGPVDQIERYFLARLPAEKPPVLNMSEEEILELRWWSIGELQATGERIYPDGLAEELTRLVGEKL